MIAKIVNNIMRLVLVGYASCSPEIMLYIPAVNPTNTKVANNIILSVFNVSQCKCIAGLCQFVTQDKKLQKKRRKSAKNCEKGVS
jgi:hypothetical protein